jgi:hypothetical protein
MNKVLNSLALPLELIQREPLQFTVWWIVAIILGLSGFWLPLLLHSVLDGSWYMYFEGYLKAGSLASFSIVVLADGIATTLVAVNAGRNLVAAGIRGLIGVFALLLTLINVAILVVPTNGKLSAGFVIFQFIITVITIITASYLYCFRSSEWEKSAGDVKKEEDREVDNLGKSANLRTADDTGVKL